MTFIAYNFGPQVNSYGANSSQQQPALPTIRYGPSGAFAYVSFEPTGAGEDSQITLKCRVGPGVGAGLARFIFTNPIAPYTSANLSAHISYAPPSIASIAGLPGVDNGALRVRRAGLPHAGRLL
jgi:hypothetical protein